MEFVDTYRKQIKIVSLCIAWYTASSINNIVGKIVLNELPYPMTITMVQLLSITFYILPLLKAWDIPNASKIPLKYWCTMIIPLAAGKFVSSVSSHISIWKVSVSYAHTGSLFIMFYTYHPFTSYNGTHILLDTRL